MRKEFTVKLTAVKTRLGSNVAEVSLLAYPDGCGGVPVAVTFPMPKEDYTAGNYCFGGKFKMTLEREEKS